MKNLPYDALNDFVPVAGTRKLPGLLIASPRLGIKNLAELTALAKRNPGKISFAAGTSSGRIGMEIYQQMASIRLLHIPYKSNTPALNDLLGGHVDVMLADIVNSLPYIKAGRVVPLAAAAKTRFKILPDLPTVAESGLVGYDVQPWTGLWVRKGTSPEAIAFLNKFANRASMAEREQVEASGAEPFITTPEEFARHIENEVAVWKRAVVAAKITPD
jgi:tripartite-type tricarboxylate transporter receptor subunit TctC